PERATHGCGRAGERPPNKPASSLSTPQGAKGSWARRWPCRWHEADLSPQSGRRHCTARPTRNLLEQDLDRIQAHRRNHRGESMTESAPPVVSTQIVVDVPIQRAFDVFTGRFGDFKPPEHTILGVA